MTRPRLCTNKYLQKRISWVSSLSHAVKCKLAPTLARQIWHHNYIIDHNEYLISTFLASTVPWVCSLQFLFKIDTHHSLRYERNCEWVFFSEHSVLYVQFLKAQANDTTSSAAAQETHSSDRARCLKVGVHEKQDLPEAFHERRTHKFGGESAGPPSPRKKN